MDRAGFAIAAIVLLVVLFIASRRERFMPVPELTCGPYPAPEYAIDVTGRGADGTVTWEPFMAASKVTDVPPRVMRRSMGLAELVRRSPSELNRDKRAACVRAVTDTDSDVVSDAVTDSTTVCESMVPAPGKMSRMYLAPDGAAGPVFGGPVAPANFTHHPGQLKMGLGSVWRDPRFQPGPQQRYVGGGGYGPAPGTHAGGDTLGALTPGEFVTPGAWDARYSHGMGNRFGPTDALAGGRVPYQALITASE